MYKLSGFCTDESDFDAVGLLFALKNACSANFLEKNAPEIPKIHEKLQTTLKFYVNFFGVAPFLT